VSPSSFYTHGLEASSTPCVCVATASSSLLAPVKPMLGTPRLYLPPLLKCKSQPVKVSFRPSPSGRYTAQTTTYTEAVIHCTSPMKTHRRVVSRPEVRGDHRRHKGDSGSVSEVATVARPSPRRAHTTCPPSLSVPRLSPVRLSFWREPSPPDPVNFLPSPHLRSWTFVRQD
jgi:hypothetical protein